MNEPIYRLLALDIDDTLLRSDRTISQRNLEAIEAARAAGVTVTIATGRGYRGAREICDMCRVNDLPVITYGGAQVVLHPAGQTLFLDTMPEELVDECVAFARELGVHLQCYDEDNYYMEQENEHSDLYATRLGYKGIVRDLVKNPVKNCTKCLVVANADETPKVRDAFLSHFGSRANIKGSYMHFVELYKPGVDKSTALRWMAGEMDITSREIIAIGDNSIDEPMLKYAGLGVAVANATDGAKEAADYICPSNDDDGVAHVIDKFILGKV